MAIQNRRGAYANFDPRSLLPGEWAVVLSGDPNADDGKAVYMCFAAGEVKRMATYEDIVDEVAAGFQDGYEVSLPAATASTIGGVKVPSGGFISLGVNGAISVNPSALAEYLLDTQDYVVGQSPITAAWDDDYEVLKVSMPAATSQNAGHMTASQASKLADLPPMVTCTQAQYDAMASHDASTLYVIAG